MPLCEVRFDTPSTTTVSSPHTLHFSLPVNDTNHANYPVFLKSIAAKFVTNTNLPTKLEFELLNLHHEPEFNTITFPLSNKGTSAPSYYYHTDMHLGDVSHQRTVNGVVRVIGSNLVQLPSQFTITCFVDSEYM